MSAVDLHGVARIFKDKIAVDHIDLKVEAGQFVTLLGPSGCGKTTTLRMIAGLEQVDAGVISIGGKTVNDATRNIALAPEKRRLGMVFQSYAIWPHMTVFDNVAYPLRIRRRPAAEIQQRVLAALQLVEMQELADRPAPALSGGQQQRVAIARAIVFEPDVLLLDEPLSNLDARLRMQMGAEFRALQQRLGITTIYVTHDQDEAMSLSDQVVVMQGGRILQIGAPTEIYHAPCSPAVASFFGVPNLLRAQVEQCSKSADGRFELSVSGKHWQGQCTSNEAFNAQDEVLVMARPESLRFTSLDETGAHRPNVWRGTVKRSSFHGASRFFEVESGDITLTLEVAGSTEVVGASVAVTTDARTLWALRPG